MYQNIIFKTHKHDQCITNYKCRYNVIVMNTVPKHTINIILYFEISYNKGTSFTRLCYLRIKNERNRKCKYMVAKNIQIYA